MNQKNEQEHQFKDVWDLWYHDPNNNDYSLESYIKISSLNSIEQFWRCYYQLKPFQLQNGMFFLMFNGVKPTWEDTIEGGSWSYKIDKKEIHQAWNKLSVYMISENFLNDVKYNDQIIGISISPKKTFSILKLWIKNSLLKDQIKLNEKIPYLKNEDPIFRSHLEIKEKNEKDSSSKS